MSITLPKYELDVFGTNPKNYIINEKVLIAENCPYLIPDGAPFFIKDVVLSTEAGAIISPSKYKLKGHQYFLDLTQSTGQKMGGFIEITDPTVLTNNAHLRVTYRTVGKYYIPRNKVPEWLEAVYNAGEGLTFDKLLNLPDLFPWNYHIHSAVTEIGDYYELTDFFKMLLGSRMRLANTIGPKIDSDFKDEYARLKGYTDFYHNAIKTHSENYNNAHGITKAMVGLGLVENNRTATLSEEISGTSSALYSTPLGVRSKIVNNVANNVSFLENGVFPISYVTGFSYTVTGKIVTINSGAVALINGTKYLMPSGTIDFVDYMQTSGVATRSIIAATVRGGVAIWEVLPENSREMDNFCLFVMKISVGVGAASPLETYTPFLIANREVTDTLSKPGSILHSSGLPMDKGVYRVQEKYLQDDPYAPY